MPKASKVSSRKKTGTHKTKSKKRKKALQSDRFFDFAGPIRFIDLFCGIGGFRLAFESTGAECVFSSDYDKFSRLTYAANFSEESRQSLNFTVRIPFKTL